MLIRQLSIFLENRPGQLLVPCRLLGDAGIDILDLSLADTERFGILRLIVEDWQRAKAVLEAAGQVVKVTELLALEVPDQPGGLARVLQVFEQAGLAVEYLYSFTVRTRGQSAILLARVEDPAGAAQKLEQHRVRLVPADELLARARR
jgi:hypothetical protein